MKKIIRETVRKQLLEVASYNEKAGYLAREYYNLICSIYKNMHKTHTFDYDNIEWGFTTKNTEIINKVKHIDWGNLKQPDIYTIMIGPFNPFNSNLHITACIVDTNFGNDEEYEQILRKHIPEAGYVTPNSKNEQVIMSVTITSKWLSDHRLISLMSHELLHVSQITQKLDIDGFFEKYEYNNSRFYPSLRKLIQKSPTFKNNKDLDMLFYILTKTEQDAYLHEIGEELHQTGRSKTYTMLKNFIDNLLNMNGLFSFEQYLSLVLLNLFGKNKKGTHKKIIRDITKFKNKLDKVYYQQQNYSE